jgi:hypothetical protein
MSMFPDHMFRDLKVVPTRRYSFCGVVPDHEATRVGVRRVNSVVERLAFGFITPVATQRNYFSKLVELADDVADRLVFSKQFVFDRKAFTLIALLALRLDLYKNSIS